MSKENPDEAAIGRWHQPGKPRAEGVDSEEGPTPGGSSHGAADLGARGTQAGGSAGLDEFESGEVRPERT